MNEEVEKTNENNNDSKNSPNMTGDYVNQLISSLSAPSEIFEKICNHLNLEDFLQLSLVNWSWRRFIFERFLEVTIEVNPQNVKERLLLVPVSSLITAHVKASGFHKVKNLAPIVCALKRHTWIQTLDLEGNEIGDEGGQAVAEALKKNFTLNELDLAENKIGNAGATAIAEALKTNSALHLLDLEDNKIGAEGGKALANILKLNNTLHTLNLWGNCIGDEGALAIAEALKHNRSLQELYIAGNGISDKGVRQVMKSMRGNQNLTVDLGWDDMLSDDTIETNPETENEMETETKTKKIDTEQRLPPEKGLFANCRVSLDKMNINMKVLESLRKSIEEKENRPDLNLLKERRQ